jgi:hypothetical protein
MRGGRESHRGCDARGHDGHGVPSETNVSRIVHRAWSITDFHAGQWHGPPPYEKFVKRILGRKRESRAARIGFVRRHVRAILLEGEACRAVSMDSLNKVRTIMPERLFSDSKSTHYGHGSDKPRPPRGSRPCFQDILGGRARAMWVIIWASAGRDAGCLLCSALNIIQQGGV